MPDPANGGSSYCDMAENIAVGYEGGTCTELDILEANNQGWQTTIHTEHGGYCEPASPRHTACFSRALARAYSTRI